MITTSCAGLVSTVLPQLTGQSVHSPTEQYGSDLDSSIHWMTWILLLKHLDTWWTLMQNTKTVYYIALVYSTSLAIRAEKICKDANIPVKLIPTPRHLSSDCGIVLRFLETHKHAVEKTLTDAKVDYDRIVPL